MKYLAWFGGVIVVLLVLIYVLIFTPIGNSLVKPYIQEQIQIKTKQNTQLSVFKLSMSDFEVAVDLDTVNLVHVKGNYSLLSQAFNIAYRVKLEKLENLKSLTNAPIQGAFRTDGIVKGSMAFMEIDGKSDVAKSQTSYHVELTKYNPTSIIAKIKDASLSSLLYIGGQKQYASANIDLDVNFKNINPHALDGDVVLNTSEGKINTEVMKKDFNLTLPQTEFSMNLDAKLQGDDIDYKYQLLSNLAKITTSGKVIPEPLQTNIVYGINIKELALLKPMSGADIRGSFKLNGHVKGTKKSLVVDGQSDLASSDTTFVATLKDFAPQKVKASIKNLDLERILFMVKQPHYTDGLLNVDLDIADARVDSLQGNVNTSIVNGLLDSEYLTETFEFNSIMPKTTFTTKTATVLDKNIIDTKVSLESTLANLDMQQVRFNMKDKSINTDFTVKIQDLDKLFFVTARHLKGGIGANGTFKKDENLELIVNSKIAGGDIKAKLYNDDFSANIKGLQTLDIERILIYPELFKASLDGELKYNLAAAKGNFAGKLKEGKFTQNQVLDSVKQYAKVDMYVETFQGNMLADINKENILASLDLTSNTSAIKTTDTKLNSLTKQIDSRITVVANKTPISVKLQGDVKAPKVEVDLKEFIKSKAGQELQDKAISEVNKLLKSKDAGNILKGLFQ